ncbi:hypothetical protein ACHAQA_010004 [Verticillium albo-atrum]
MLSNNFIKLAALLLTVAKGSSAARMACYDESTALHCYNTEWDIPQEVDEADVTFIAAALRAYGRETRAGRQLVMKAADAPDCGEWSLYTRGTAQAVAKKIDMSYDSSILFEEIANSIDGGTGFIKRNGLYECGTDGGSYGVQVNATAAAYKTAAYVAAGYKPEGIIVKIVANL